MLERLPRGLNPLGTILSQKTPMLRFDGDVKWALPIFYKGLIDILPGEILKTRFFLYIEENSTLLNASGPNKNRTGWTFAELGMPEVVQKCDHDEIKARIAAEEGEVTEPECQEGFIVRFPQFIHGYEVVGTSLAAFFDKDGSLTGLQGEHIGWIEEPASHTITVGNAKNLISQYYDINEYDFNLKRIRFLYMYRNGFVPVIGLMVRSSFNELYVEAFIDADSGAVLEINDFEDRTDVRTWGYAMEDKEDYVCNSPVFQAQWAADDTYQDGSGNQAAFNSKVHIYDWRTESGDIIYPLYSNDQYLFRGHFNYGCTGSPTGDTCANNDNPSDTINIWDVSTFTAWVQLINAYDFTSNLGFDPDDGFWPDGLALVVIINRTSDLCGPGCFIYTGYSFERDEEPNQYNPYYEVDRYDADADPEEDGYRPTIVVGGNVFYQIDGSPPTSYYNATHHATTYHEFYHYVIRTYFSNTGNSFGSSEGTPINEGLAIFFAASRENESTSNFYRDQLRCNSDDVDSSISMLLSYAKTFQCCSSVHDRGRVLTQILWDLREGIGAGISALGKYYTERLLVYATLRLGSDSVETMEDVFDTMFAVAGNELSGQCTIGSQTNGDCQDNIEAAFNRHGVCTSFPCGYVVRSCHGGVSCNNVPCLNAISETDCDEVHRPVDGIRCDQTGEETPSCN